jgi:hypothetical protein
MTRARLLSALWIRASANSNSSLINLAWEHRSSPNAVAVISGWSSLDKFDAEPALQPIHRFRECRLRNFQALGCLVQAPLLDHSGKIEKLASVHEELHGRLSIIKST